MKLIHISAAVLSSISFILIIRLNTLLCISCPDLSPISCMLPNINGNKAQLSPISFMLMYELNLLFSCRLLLLYLPPNSPRFMVRALEPPSTSSHCSRVLYYPVPSLAIIACIKGTVSRDFLLQVFYESSSPTPLKIK